jgi:hypothetical protein
MILDYNIKRNRLKKILILMASIELLLLSLAGYVMAQFYDQDGHLTIGWDPPSYGTPISNYIWSYEINGSLDSIRGNSPSDARFDSSVTLLNHGDWALFFIKAISIYNDTSSIAYSDTAFSNTCRYISGDLNGDGTTNGIDVAFGVNYFKGSCAAPPVNCHPTCPDEPDPFYAARDVNGNCAFSGIDITYFVRYLKGRVPSLLYCADCPPGGYIMPPAGIIRGKMR